MIPPSRNTQQPQSSSSQKLWDSRKTDRKNAENQRQRDAARNERERLRSQQQLNANETIKNNNNNSSSSSSSSNSDNSDLETETSKFSKQSTSQLLISLYSSIKANTTRITKSRSEITLILIERDDILQSRNQSHAVPQEWALRFERAMRDLVELSIEAVTKILKFINLAPASLTKKYGIHERLWPFATYDTILIFRQQKTLLSPSLKTLCRIADLCRYEGQNSEAIKHYRLATLDFPYLGVYHHSLGLLTQAPIISSTALFLKSLSTQKPHEPSREKLFEIFMDLKPNREFINVFLRVVGILVSRIGLDDFEDAIDDFSDNFKRWVNPINSCNNNNPRNPHFLDEVKDEETLLRQWRDLILSMILSIHVSSDYTNGLYFFGTFLSLSLQHIQAPGPLLLVDISFMWMLSWNEAQFESFCRHTPKSVWVDIALALNRLQDAPEGNGQSVGFLPEDLDLRGLTPFHATHSKDAKNPLVDPRKTSKEAKVNASLLWASKSSQILDSTGLTVLNGGEPLLLLRKSRILISATQLSTKFDQLSLGKDGYWTPNLQAGDFAENSTQPLPVPTFQPLAPTSSPPPPSEPTLNLSHFCSANDEDEDSEVIILQARKNALLNSKAINPQMTYAKEDTTLVLDTNCWLKYSDEIQNLSKTWKIIVPLIVLTELIGLKLSPDRSLQATKAISVISIHRHSISIQTVQGHVVPFNLRLKEQLPEDIKSNDEAIIRTCAATTTGLNDKNLRLLVTNDVNMRLKADSREIHSMAYPRFKTFV